MLQVICLSTPPPPVPTIDWKKAYGSPGNDVPYSIAATSGGGTIMAGYVSSIGGDVSASKGSQDAWIVKTNNTGVIEWEKSLGGVQNDIFKMIRTTSDGGYIAIGESYSNDQDVSGHHGTSATADLWVVKLSSTGTIEWQKSLGGSSQEKARDIIATTDGGYIAVGATASSDGDVSGYHGALSNDDAWVVKLGSTGVIQWQKCIGGSSVDDAKSIVQNSDGSYVFGGMSGSTDGDLTGVSRYSNVDYWIVKLNSTGVIQWQKCLGGNSDDLGDALCKTLDGGYVIAGMSFSSTGDVNTTHAGGEVWVAKVDNNGGLQWKYAFGGTLNDEGYSITPTSDGGVAIAGHTFSNDGDVTVHYGATTSSDYWVLKLSAAGSLQWQKSYGGTNVDQAGAIVQLSNGSYLITGATLSNDQDVSGNHGAADYWTLQLGQSVLPVKLSLFNAVRDGKVNLLHWRAESEVNLASYEVQRSKDGTTYNVIGTVTAGAFDYSYRDESPLKGINFYRLKMLDKDGRSEYSAVRTVSNEKNITVMIYPNPVMDKAILDINVSASVTLYYEVVNSIGEILIKNNVVLPAGTNRQFIDMQHLPKGSYLLRVAAANEHITIPVVKQ
jgi:hypothetical protein